jgi:hypothetical protein
MGMGLTGTMMTAMLAMEQEKLSRAVQTANVMGAEKVRYVMRTYIGSGGVDGCMEFRE